MTYVAPSDIRFAVAPDGSNAGTCAELDDEQLQLRIQQAQDLVNGYTATPFNDWNVPSLIKQLVIQLATFYATLAYRKGKALETMHPVYLGYQDAQRTLQGIKTGAIEFEPPPPDNEALPARRRPKVNNAVRSGAEMFPLRDFGMAVVSGEDDNQGYLITQDPATNNTGFA